MKPLLLLLVFTFAARAETTREGFLAAATLELLERAVASKMQNNTAELEQLMKTGLVVWLEPGLRVHVVDSPPETNFNRVLIRPRGKTKQIWTVRDALLAP